MASIASVIWTRLDNHAGLTALVGSRVYQMTLPDIPVYPAVTMQQIGGGPFHGMTADYGIDELRFQMDSWGDTIISAHLVAAQVKDALSRWADATTSPVILDVMLDNELDEFDSDLQSNAGAYHVVQDYIFMHRE